MLQVAPIQQIIKLGICDVSSITREAALDIISNNLGNLAKIANCDGSQMNGLQFYIGMVMARANFDTNLSVRKKVIQILSLVLDSDIAANDQWDRLKVEIIQTLILKWSDSSETVRQSLIQSIQKLIKVKAATK